MLKLRSSVTGATFQGLKRHMCLVAAVWGNSDLEQLLLESSGRQGWFTTVVPKHVPGQQQPCQLRAPEKCKSAGRTQTY